MKESAPTGRTSAEDDALAVDVPGMLVRDGYSPTEFLSYMNGGGLARKRLHFRDGEKWHWPTTASFEKDFSDSVYATPDGVNWMFDLLDSLGKDQTFEEMYPRGLDIESQEKYIGTEDEMDRFVQDDTLGSNGTYVPSRHALYFNETYSQEKRVLEVAGKYGSETNIDRIVQFAQTKYRGVLHRNHLASVLSELGAEKAGDALLKALRAEGQEPSDKWAGRRKKELAGILYRLELGRIGISEEGVEYLGKRFDLGEWNNPRYTVRRVSPSGDVGVIDEYDVLQRIFNLGDLARETDRPVSPELFEISKDMLFTPRADETPEEVALRESILEEFKQKYNSFYDEAFLRKTGIHVNNLSLKEQGWFLLFVRQASEQQQARAYSFVQTYGEDGFRAFLATEYGDQVGERVLELGERVDAEKVRPIFELYGAVLEQAETLRKKLHIQQGAEREVESFVSRAIDQVHEAIVRRSKDLLLAAHAIGVEHAETELTLDDVWYALRGVEKMLTILGSFTGDGLYDVPFDRQQNDSYLYRVRESKTGHEYTLKVLVRPQHEIGRDGEVKAQARVNFELGFDTASADSVLCTAFKQKTEYLDTMKTVEESVLRMGIDLDTYGDSDAVSFDMGRNAREGIVKSGRYRRSGDIVGQLLELASESGHHNTASFDKAFADPDTFAKIARSLKEYFARPMDATFSSTQ